MRWKIITIVTMLLVLFLAREHLVVHHLAHGKSILTAVACKIHGNSCHSDPRTPKIPFSHSMGWAGLFCILATNLYFLRKYWLPLQNLGDLESWLKWHMAFGIWGPLLVLFHTGFRANGLVAVSLWSMLIVVASGIIGYFLYLQLLDQDQTLTQRITAIEGELEKTIQAIPPPVSREALDQAKARALAVVGYNALNEKLGLWAPALVFEAFLRDIGFWCMSPFNFWRHNAQMHQQVHQWALLKRRQRLIAKYQRAMGYWHALHGPFSYLMYFTVAIHIAAALVFRVS